MNNSGLDDVINGCRRGSVQHKELLYKNYYGYIKGIVIRYINDYHIGEELINDSFIKIFDNISSFKNLNGNTQDVHLSFKSWVAKIASRTAIDYLRKKKIDISAEEISENHIPVNNVKVNVINEVKDILNLLNQLPDVQKLVFNLHEIEGFTHEEISKILTISESVSRVYLSRAKNNLKNLYAKNFNY